MGTFGVIVLALAVTGDSRVDPAADYCEVLLATRRFLEAVRTGDEKTAAAMLSAKARKKTAAMNMQVAPAGSDTASFRVGEVVLHGEGSACASCAWTDVDDFGKPCTERVTWALRRETGGWRVSGMLVSVVPGEPPILLNFEDPQDMLSKQAAIQKTAQEIASKAAKEKGSGAARPGN